jgi:hypothetical protein
MIMMHGGGFSLGPTQQNKFVTSGSVVLDEEAAGHGDDVDDDAIAGDDDDAIAGDDDDAIAGDDAKSVEQPDPSSSSLPATCGGDASGKDEANFSVVVRDGWACSSFGRGYLRSLQGLPWCVRKRVIHARALSGE